jgi:RNA polymerase sigma-70 factor (ECF subfamily)
VAGRRRAPSPGAWLTATRTAIGRIRRQDKRDDKQKEARMLDGNDRPGIARAKARIKAAIA